jgi:anti-anti-sigma factor
MSPLARVFDEHTGDIAIAVVDGEIDASNARDIGDRLRASPTNHSHALIVDLEEARYLDSAGIRLLFELDLELRQRRQRLHLIVPPRSPIARTLAITGLHRAVATHGTREAALERASVIEG